MTSLDGPTVYRPRAILADIDVDSIEVQMKRPMRYAGSSVVFSPNSFVFDKHLDSTGGTWASGKRIGQTLKERLCEQLRKQGEQCDYPVDFQLFRSYGGGTGVGLGGVVLDILTEDFGRRSVFDYGIWPGSVSRRFSTSVFEDFNAMFALDQLFRSNKDTVNIAMDNDALCSFAENQLGIADPTIRDCNDIVARLVCHLTASQRLAEPGEHWSGNQAFRTSLLCYNTMKVVVPRLCLSAQSEEELATRLLPAVDEAADNAFSLLSGAKRSVPYSQYWASVLCCAGHRSELTKALGSLKDIEQSQSTPLRASCCPEPFHLVEIPSRRTHAGPTTLTSGSDPQVALSGASLTNDGAAAAMLNTIAHRIDLLYSKRAFNFHISASDSRENSGVRESLAAMVYDYVDADLPDRPDVEGEEEYVDEY